MNNGIDDILSNPNRKVILSILLQDGKGHTAYSLEKCSGLSISISAISQHLKKMEEFGLVCGKVPEDSVEEGRYKKIYTIKDECKKVLMERIKDDIRMFISNMPLTDRIYFLKSIESILNIPRDQLSLHTMNRMSIDDEGGDVHD
ncbi:MAG TPA: ArsR family transcriptional regulator [Candidatus Syntrophoarchaeum butanivorans]|nr:MAG: Bacterial regulatory protein, ArsR domain protein [Candidatus Syntrophoarchaeum butanivorans]RJS72891.1 MAG: ArsR family transcriptional regulator [Candidatus Syntrophoarchaeum sp. WYZ-LMO15]HEC57168.1 ArsR family transcriptional regulator [Candidatus Syntrophoarchaeum butanivorans]